MRVWRVRSITWLASRSPGILQFANCVGPTRHTHVQAFKMDPDGKPLWIKAPRSTRIHPPPPTPPQHTHVFGKPARHCGRTCTSGPVAEFTSKQVNCDALAALTTWPLAYTPPRRHGGGKANMHDGDSTEGWLSRSVAQARLGYNLQAPQLGGGGGVAGGDSARVHAPATKVHAQTRPRVLKQAVRKSAGGGM